MVSIMLMPLSVVLLILAASRCCTRVILTRLAVMIWLTPMLIRMAPTPIRLSIQLYRIMTTR